MSRPLLVLVAAPKPDFAARMESEQLQLGHLVALRHAARLSATPPRYRRPSSRPGTDRLAWD